MSPCRRCAKSHGATSRRALRAPYERSLSRLEARHAWFAPIPQILTRAIEQTYFDVGWDDDTVLENGVQPPTLRDLARTFQAVFDAVGYEGEARNIGRAFQARLSGLLSGSRGRMLDTVPSTDFAALLEAPVLIELQDIPDTDERALVAALVLGRVRAAAERRGNSGGELRHVTLLEEAHRLLSGSAGPVAAAEGQAESGRSEAVRMFCEAIAELRSYGEGFVICSPSPSALAEPAISNTGRGSCTAWRQRQIAT